MSATMALRESGLSEAQVERFQHDGFLLVEDFFSSEELEAFGRHVDAAVAYRTSDDERKLGEKSDYEQTFVQCMRLWEDHAAIRPFTFHPKLCAAAAALLRAERVRLWHDQALYKEPGGRQTDAHMDYPFWPVDRDELVSVWIPFEGVGEGGGRMSYVQGSHVAGVTKFVDIGQLRGGAPVDILDEPQLEGLSVVPVDAPKGSAVFHHACTVHLADANATERTRRVFTMAYMADGCRRSHEEPYFALDRDQLKSGDVIVGPGHPIAWPLAAGQWPDPPSELGPSTGFAFSMDEVK
ncbi:MAG: phytanoyl-CoA dioxygenase family protein [Pseudomonadota bacterium]